MDIGGTWEAWDGAPTGVTVAVSAATAAAVRETWPTASGVAEFTVSALAGPDGQRNTWYLGFAPAESPRFAVALVLEDAADVAAAAEIGRALLEAAVE